MRYLLVFLVAFCFFSFSPKPHEQHAGLIPLAYSPDGKHILASSTHYTGLYLINAQNLEIEKSFLTQENIGYNAQWSADGKKIYYRKKNDFVFKAYSISVSLQKIEYKPTINPDWFTNQSFGKNKEKIAFLNAKQEIAVRQKANNNRVISPIGKAYYHLISFNQNRQIIAHSGNQIYLVNAKTGQEQPLVTGIANAVSRDGNMLYYFLDESEDGHHISNSELYAYNLTTHQTTTLTNTPQEIEMWPILSPDGKTLAYTEALSGKIKKIILAK